MELAVSSFSASKAGKAFEGLDVQQIIEVFRLMVLSRRLDERVNKKINLIKKI